MTVTESRTRLTLEEARRGGYVSVREARERFGFDSNALFRYARMGRARRTLVQQNKEHIIYVYNVSDALDEERKLWGREPHPERRDYIRFLDATGIFNVSLSMLWSWIREHAIPILEEEGVLLIKRSALESVASAQEDQKNRIAIPSGYMTLRELARATRISELSLATMCRSGQIQAKKIRYNNKPLWIIPSEVVDRLRKPIRTEQITPLPDTTPAPLQTRPVEPPSFSPIMEGHAFVPIVYLEEKDRKIDQLRERVWALELELFRLRPAEARSRHLWRRWLRRDDV